MLDELGLPWEQARRNIATRGIDLNALAGRRFRVGTVECVGRRLAEPCAHLERVSGRRLLRPLVHRAGLRADILGGGTITVGDRVAAVDRVASSYKPFPARVQARPLGVIALGVEVVVAHRRRISPLDGSRLRSTWLAGSRDPSGSSAFEHCV